MHIDFLGDFSIDVLFTPGHTRGGVCFLIGNFLFTGDTLLRGRVGRVDLPEGDRASLTLRYVHGPIHDFSYLAPD